MKDKILRTYMGVVTDSLGGRDDGYPERKYSSHETLEAAVSRARPGIGREHINSEEFFELVPISKERVDAALAARKRAEQRAAAVELDRQIDQLTAKRKRLRGKGARG